MNITDKQRRDIAAKLRAEARDMDERSWEAVEAWEGASVFNIIWESLGLSNLDEARSLLGVLADLIEPQGYRPSIAALSTAAYLRALGHARAYKSIPMYPLELMTIARLLEKGRLDD